MFIGQQFLQNVLGYSTCRGRAVDPAGGASSWCSSRRARRRSSRRAARAFTLLFGYVFVLLGFLTMLLLWKEGIPYWKVGLGYALVGIGVGLAGTPASHSLTGSVPVRRVGMASGTADLQRDLGGAIMQSIFGALLTAGYAAAAGAAIVASRARTSRSTSRTQLTKSFDGAEAIAQAVPELTPSRSSRPRRRRSCTATSGPTRRGSSPCCSARRSSSSASRSASARRSCSRSTPPRTQARPLPQRPALPRSRRLRIDPRVNRLVSHERASWLAAAETGIVRHYPSSERRRSPWRRPRRRSRRKATCS